MKNKKLIEIRIKPSGYTIGCYNKDMEKIPKSELIKIFEVLEAYDYTDVDIKIDGKEYVVERIATHSRDFSHELVANYICYYKFYTHLFNLLDFIIYIC